MIKRFLILTLSALTAFLGRSAGSAPGLLNGDLLFQTEGESALSKAISSSTGKAGVQEEGVTPDVSFAHVAILWIAGDSLKVIEASPNEGVRITTLEDFLADSPKIGGSPGVVVKRLQCEETLKQKGVKRALEHLGEPYDWYYLPGNGMMYCSELVFESYLAEDGSHLFHSNPMNFRNSDGTMPDYWVTLYQELGVDIPEGLPGTNPNDMSKESGLLEIYRYF